MNQCRSLVIYLLSTRKYKTNMDIVFQLKGTFMQKNDVARDDIE
jgi:hypothetical protein